MSQLPVVKATDLGKRLPAIGITIAMFVVVFVGLFPLRPHYAEPERLVIAVATRLCRTP
jgi:hypothetical protein